MKNRNLKLMGFVQCLLFLVLIFPKITLAASIPSTPTDLQASVESSSTIYLSWDSVTNATFYYVYRATSSSGTYSKIATTTVTHYINTGLTADTTYHYKVQAANSSGTSSYSSREDATTSDESDSDLPTPTNLSAEVENSSEIYLNWDSVSEATSYYVYRSTTSSGTYSKIATTTSSNYTDNDLDEGTTYYYKVKAVNSSGTSDFSVRKYATISDELNSDLSAPTDLSAELKDSDQIYLDWDSVSDATSYYVYRSTSSSGTYTKIATATSSNYTDTDLVEDTTYYYKVKAVNSSGTSDYSSKEHVSTSEESNSGLSAPTDLSAKATNSSEIYLNWDSVSEATSYYVYRSTSSSGTYTKIDSTSTSSYSNTGLTPDTTYYYKVQAVNSSDISSYSSNTYATTTKSNNAVPSDNSPQNQPIRLAGEDMYATSTEVAKSGWKTSYYAIVVSGENFSDALCSAPLAQKYNAPLLLTSKDSLNVQAKNQLSRLKVKSVFIIGGSGIISSNIEQSIKDMGIEVTRIAGNDRYETSIKIAQSMGQFEQAVVASGDSFPDALSIAPIAAMKGIPILLTSKDSLPASIKAYLLKNVQSTYVVGGTGVISDSVFAQLPSPKRLSGYTRYETNVSIIKEFANELDFTTCYFSTGEYFADALSGSALASLSNSPLILVNSPVEQSTIAFVRSKLSSIEQEIVFGGTVVVPESVLITINDGITEGSDIPSSPRYITATTESSSQINLNWESVNGATYYYVYGATSPTGTYTRVASVTTPNYSNSGLWADTTYYYKVQAVNSSGSSSYSPVAIAKTSLDY